MDLLSTQENYIMVWSKGHKGRPEAWERLSSGLAKVVPRSLKVVPRSLKVVPKGH